MEKLTREDCLRFDLDDPLAHFKNEFSLPEQMIYMSGNSLGAMPVRAIAKAHQTVAEEWGRGLVKSWNQHDWFHMTTRLGALIAPTIGADDDEVVMTDSTGINVFKVLSAALTLRPERCRILMEGSNFPTDNYTAQGLVKLLGADHEIVYAEGDEIAEKIDDSIAVVCLTQVHYKTGRVLNMHDLTAKAHAVGAVTIWDLCHSAGAMVVDLNGCNVDFAVGCTYKYYNGGPGSPAFIFAARRHHGKALQPLTGWYGHKSPFAFERDYTPAADIVQMLSGTQPILSMSVAEVGLEIMSRVNMAQIRAKSLRLGDVFIQLLQQECPDAGFELVSPSDDSRGSQIALSHPQGYAIVQALISCGVVGDFRAPNILRFGLTPLYLRYVDIWDAIAHIKDIMGTGRWQEPRFNQRHAVT
ncbi:MAG: kynureninase [Shewanella sp.]|uniref:Kynureninase n=1 Tax=Shewanella cutis TaxID=2766780 RepID=A0ABS9R0M8_9GAMM|nr:kynureninase [Shewanella sp. PS-2]